VFQVKAKIIKNKLVKGSYFHLLLNAPEIAKKASPGQFVNIKVSDNLEPLLRRPLSIHRVNKNNIQMLYEVVGKGTQILSKRKSGEYLDIVGPLGNGFKLTSKGSGLNILVAGGMGVAPLLFLAERLADRKLQMAKHRDLVLIGAKTKNQVCCVDEFKKIGCDVKLATDDGTVGFRGRVTALLKEVLRLATSDKRLAIYACGPRPMLKAVSEISRKFKVPAQISLEEHMGCGIGACMGCVVRTNFGYKRVCKDGPVFLSDEIIWEEKE
jgi:dihydroorotate dehydrogenase electron transfer subunit